MRDAIEFAVRARLYANDWHVDRAEDLVAATVQETLAVLRESAMWVALGLWVFVTGGVDLDVVP